MNEEKIRQWLVDVGKLLAGVGQLFIGIGAIIAGSSATDIVTAISNKNVNNNTSSVSFYTACSEQKIKVKKAVEDSPDGDSKAVDTYLRNIFPESPKRGETSVYLPKDSREMIIKEWKNIKSDADKEKLLEQELKFGN